MMQKTRVIISMFVLMLQLLTTSVNASAIHDELPAPKSVINEVINVCNFFDDIKAYMMASGDDVVNYCDKVTKIKKFFPNIFHAVKQESYMRNRIWGRFLFDFMLDIVTLYKDNVIEYYEKEIIHIINDAHKVVSSLNSDKRINKEQRNAVIIIKKFNEESSRISSAADSLHFDDEKGRLILFFSIDCPSTKQS